MLVLKFGGTSVGSAEAIKNVAKLIINNEQKIVVLSAMSGTTNSLVDICNYLYKNNQEGANEIINSLESKYYSVIDELYSSDKYKQKGKELVENHFDAIRMFTIDMFTAFEEKAILAQGELLSTAMMDFYLHEKGIDSKLISALDFMRIDKNSEPDLSYIKENLSKELKKYPDTTIFITQGYICRNAFGEIDNLKRGGSDYSASLIGNVVNAKEIQIWTDIDGMHNSDPRYVENTHSIASLSYDEAAELAYFGAKILHPTCILPARLAGIPVKLLNTMEPDAHGTIISSHQEKNRVTAIAAKDGITVIKIKSGRMLLAYGFLRKVFEIFESYKTPIDMISTSEVGVSLTIDDESNLDNISESLRKYADVSIDKNQVIICIVGDLVAERKGYVGKIFNALKEIPVRMISYGGSNYNVSLLVNEEYKEKALKVLNDKLF